MYNQNSRALNNPICAYRNCRSKSSIRLLFALGFSALFCDNCAKILVSDGLAEFNIYQHNEDKNNATDRPTTRNSVAVNHYTSEVTKAND